MLLLLNDASAYKPITGHVVEVSRLIGFSLSRIYDRLEVRYKLHLVRQHINISHNFVCHNAKLAKSPDIHNGRIDSRLVYSAKNDYLCAKHPLQRYNTVNQISDSIIFVSLAMLLNILASGCTNESVEDRLDAAESVIDTRPDSALALLSDIPVSDLSDNHRALHALLSVKATDRLYIPHTNDSAAMVALDYYGNGKPSLRAAEAHYYVGRVNYDTRHYTRALKGFHEALRTLEETGTNSIAAIRLKSAIVSQQAQLLSRIQLHREAVPFYREAIRYDSILADTLNLFYDMSDLAFVLMQMQRGDSARIILNQILPICHGLTPSSATETYALMASSYLRDKQYDLAAKYLDSINPHINPSDNSPTLSVIAQIYDKSGQPDSAAHYARILKTKPDNQLAAHIILANHSLASGNIDTIAAYHDSLAQFAVRMIDRHTSNLNLPGYMFYRLMTSEVDNSRLKRRNDRLTFSVLILSLGAAVCVIVILAILYRRSYRKQKDGEAVSQIQQVILTHEPAQIVSKLSSSDSGDPRDTLVDSLLLRMEELAQRPYMLPASLRESPVVRHLKDMIAANQPLASTPTLWNDLEEAIVSVAPDFKPSIVLLLGNPSVNDYHTALLIKAGFTPTEIATLLCRSKGTISSNRQRMCERIFKRKINNTLFDNIIRSI